MKNESATQPHRKTNTGNRGNEVRSNREIQRGKQKKERRKKGGKKKGSLESSTRRRGISMGDHVVADTTILREMSAEQKQLLVGRNVADKR